MFHSYEGTFKMKTQIVYLTIAMGVLSLTTSIISGQARLPEYRDTSQTITIEELILEQTRLSKERQTKRETSRLARQKTHDSIPPSVKSQHNNNEQNNLKKGHAYKIRSKSEN